MTFREYIDECNELIKKHPELAKAKVVYSADDEGNHFGEVHYGPSIGVYNDDEFEFSSDQEDWEECNVECYEKRTDYDGKTWEDRINAICIN